MQRPQPKKTTKRYLRGTFNDSAFRSSLLKRTTQSVLRYDELAPIDAVEPPGTMSQIHDYLDASGIKLAAVHRYKRSDGSIGASGLLDPHALLIDGVLFCDP